MGFIPSGGSTNVYTWFSSRIKILVNTDISVIGFYGYIGKISTDIFTKILVRLKLYIKILKIKNTFNKNIGLIG